MPAVVPAATVRLEARITPELHGLLKRAAELQGRTMTDFVVSAVQDAAMRVVEQAEVVRLSLVDQQAFADALLGPPKANAALKKAVTRRKQLLQFG